MLGRISQSLSCRSISWSAFILAGVVLYGFTLGYPFVFDSCLFLENNQLLSTPEAFHDLLNIDSFLSKYLFRLDYTDLTFSFLLRPVSYATFRLNYLFGGLVPEGYRIVNIAVHIANAIMLYELLCFIISQRNNEAESTNKISIPFFAALLFLVHPLQTESVTHVVQRFTLLGTFFYLLTALLYLKSHPVEKTHLRRWVYAGSIFTLLLGMFAKEIVMTVPIALVMIEVLLLRRPWRRSALLLAPHIAFICLIPLRLLYIAEKVDRYKFDTTNIIGSSYPRYEYAVTQIRAVLSYIRLLVLPYNQNLDPDYPLYHSLLNPEIILSLTIWGCILMAGAGLLLRSKRETSTDLTGFSIFWFILSISISSSVVPQTDLMLEHHTYLPSLAFCTGSAAYLQHLMSGRSLLQQNAAIGGICLIILCFASLTVQRNQVYRSRLSVYSDTARKSPDKDRSNYALGNEYFEQFQFDQALPYLKKSLKINPENIQAYLSLGDSYRLMDRPLEAIALYNRYLETHPPQRKILMNLAWTYATSGKLPEAISTMQILLRITNNEAQMLAFVAELYLRAGNVREAQNYLEQAREADKFDTLIDMSLKLIQLEKMIQDSVAKNNANSF